MVQKSKAKGRTAPAIKSRTSIRKRPQIEVYSIMDRNVPTVTPVTTQLGTIMMRYVGVQENHPTTDNVHVYRSDDFDVKLSDGTYPASIYAEINVINGDYLGRVYVAGAVHQPYNDSIEGTVPGVSRSLPLGDEGLMTMTNQIIDRFVMMGDVSKSAKKSKVKKSMRESSIRKNETHEWVDVQEWIATHVDTIDNLYDQYHANHEWTDEEKNLYDEVDVELAMAVNQAREYAQFLEEEMNKSTRKSKVKKSAIRKQKVEFYNDELFAYMKEYGFLVGVIDENTAERAIENAIDMIQYDIENNETSNYFFSGCEYYFDKDATMDLIRNEFLDKLEESTRKSRMQRLNKKLSKLGGFTKEDDEEDVEIDIDVKGEDDEDEEFLDETVQEIEGKPESIEEGCKSRKALRTRKYRKMRKEGINLPEDADDQQDINEKGSGNAGSELPEDADDVKEVNDAGSGSAGADLPEDQDDAEDQKQAFRKRRKGVRKFSVTAGGSPDQTSYIDRYNQAPRMREAIDRHFIPGKTDVDMLQDRIDEMAKSRRNSTGNNIPTKLKRR